MVTVFSQTPHSRSFGVSDLTQDDCHDTTLDATFFHIGPSNFKDLAHGKMGVFRAKEPSYNRVIRGMTVEKIAIVGG